MGRQAIYSTLVLIAITLVACGPATPGPGAPGAGPAQPAGPKTVVIGILQEPTGFGPFHSCTSGGGCHQLEEIGMRYLASLDNQTRPYPEVASELPAVDKGTWTVFPDGTMETTLKLRPNVKWHDGTPMLADDWVFGWEVDRDPLMPNFTTVPVRYIDSLKAVDDTTIVLHWTQPYPYADALVREHVNPMQRAKHEALYRADRERFINSPAWNFEYVGLGPFKLVDWRQGSQIRYEAFEDFYRGRPKLDVVIVRFLHDPTTLLANILSDSIDVYLPLGLDEEAAHELQRGWAAPGTGNQMLVYPDGRLRYLEIQNRPDYQRPKALADRRVREAIYRAIDRQELMEVVTGGLGKPADSWLLPDDPLRSSVFRGAIADYSRNPERAQRLLEEAGFRRGADGVLAHQPSGDRFETAVWNTRGGGNEKENAIVAGHMRALGMQVEQYIIPTSRMDDSEHRASFPSTNMTARTVTLDFENAIFRYRPPTATSPLGSPRHGYNNPRMIDLVDRLQVTVNESDRLQVQRQIMEVIFQDLPILPMYWNVETLTLRKGITGPGPRTGRHVNYPLTTWNVHEWDRT